MAAGLEVLPISINAAPVEFLRDDYAEKLLQRIQQYGIPHHTVELEITEQSLSERGANYVRRALNLLYDGAAALIELPLLVYAVRYVGGNWQQIWQSVAGAQGHLPVLSAKRHPQHARQ